MTEQAKNVADAKVVKTLLSLKQVTSFFQPIISIASRGVIGFEAFSRPVGEYSGIDTRMLFDGGLGSDVMLEMDRLCRMTALRQFKPIHDRHKGMLLFLKVNAQSLPLLDPNRLVLLDQLKEAGVDVGAVAPELPLVPEHLDQIVPLFGKLREMGVRVCLDNCALDAAVSYALNLLRPDFVKLNRSFFGDGVNAQHAGATLAGAVSQANRIGAQVIAQGVETEDESVRLLAAGINLQQGFFYSKDEGTKPDDTPKLLREKIDRVNRRFQEARQQTIRRKKEGFADAFSRAGKVVIKLSNVPEDRFDEVCRSVVGRDNGPISVFVLDERGVQLTERVCAGESCVFGSNGAIYGSQRGADHSSQDYALYIEMGYNQFVTPPFTSVVTGGRACLISKPFFNTQGVRFTMCLEMPYPG